MKGRLIIALIFIATIVAAVIDPLHLNRNPNSLLAAVYGIAGLVAVIIAYKKLNK